MDYIKNNVEIFDKYALKYQEKYMDVAYYKNGLNIFCNALNQVNPVVLDIGCGPANLSKYLISHKPDIQLFGVDLSENMLELARINIPSATFELLDCRDIDKIQLKYDGIICGFCLPYLSRQDVTKLIKDVAALLNTEGSIYLSFMQGDYQKSGWQGSSDEEQMHTYFYQHDDLSAQLLNSGFQIIFSQQLASPVNASSKTYDRVIIAKKS